MPPDAGSEEKPRILFAPQEIGGQMQLLAETLRTQGFDATAVSYFKGRGGLIYRNDIHFDLDPHRVDLRKLVGVARFLPGAIHHYDVFHFFFAQSLVPRFQWDLPLLRALGKRIFVHFRGSDIADRSVAGNDLAPTVPHAKGARRILQWRKHAHGMFVSTPDLLRIVPDAALIPQAIDLRRWPFSPSVGSDGKKTVRVAHAPSNRALKGTDSVIDAVDRLRAEGIDVELVLVENLSPAETATLYRQCDIAVDQLRIGWYGNFAVEMMALGKPVIAYIDPRLRYDDELPVISATRDTVAEVLRATVAARETWLAVGEAGRRYVERVHAADVVAGQILREYARVG